VGFAELDDQSWAAENLCNAGGKGVVFGCRVCVAICEAVRLEGVRCVQFWLSLSPREQCKAKTGGCDFWQMPKQMKRESATTTIKTTRTQHRQKKKHKKRTQARTDTFWHRTEESVGEYFDAILLGRSQHYTLNLKAEINLDYSGKVRACWMVTSRKTGQRVSGLLSTDPYRLALLWSVYTHKDYYSKRRRQRAEADLPRIKGKHADHSRHLCGNSWCCNPGHIRVGTRKSNEVDKHFHHFLRHPDLEVCANFMHNFKDLCKQQGVWGRLPSQIFKIGLD